MNNIFVKYDSYGRMGNRMFQLAFGKILATITGRQIWADPLPNFKNTYIDVPTIIKHPSDPISIKQMFGDNYVDIDYLKTTTNDIVIDSFVQNYTYYKDHKNYLKYLFELPEQLQIPDKNELVVHIRETDYKILKKDISHEYYYKAVSKLGYDKISIITDDANSPTVVSLKNKGFNVVSDKPIQSFSHHNDDNVMRDFVYMIKANHLLIAQSSFSWWPAFLGEHEHLYVPHIEGMWKNNPGKNDICLCMPHFIKIGE